MARTANGKPVLWSPNPGPQTEFLSSTAYEVLYGGAAGGGKTDALLVAPLRWVGLPKFHAGLFRRTYPELEASLIERSRSYYPQLGAQYNETKHLWRFPSGARIVFRALQYEKDVYAHQSDEFHFLGFDELTHFERTQYRYLLSRHRGPPEYPLRIRSGTNPDINWVKDRWAPWVNRSQEYLDSGQPIAQSGDVLWFRPNDDGGEDYVRKGTPGSKSRTFIRSTRRDTPQLSADYETQLRMLDAVQRARLQDGDWEAVPAAGKYYKREWCDTCSLDDVPSEARFVRAWDLAGTEKGEGKASDPDWTAGVKMARKGAHYWICNVQRFRKTPAGVEEHIKRTANEDGRTVAVRFPQDPGQAGKSQARKLVQMLSGWPVRTKPVRGDKVKRFAGFSAQAEHNNVTVVRGPWNDAFNHELESFPEGAHDDIVDGASDGFDHLTTTSDGGMSSEPIGLF